jgi:hypothetical protein
MTISTKSIPENAFQLAECDELLTELSAADEAVLAGGKHHKDKRHGHSSRSSSGGHGHGGHGHGGHGHGGHGHGGHGHGYRYDYQYYYHH